eukprot:CAMPEP_0173380376 /NCGR_PEP_ID=MMETSP1356-20130122/3081_1 /TAXON_ID=77927 ORGANISM="Hemiselmis virescens, Strain PCC157" /NCGR_SAMPLE_ID=MMETSP1356 /ASSEMBLY_ACC=CAM_ASM_000847 /LENGTH=156 /DNA_ID=CAMNT_0014333949 /DNA_START=35 /DNA_END=502 /DNA_ORIENTATION=+
MPDLLASLSSLATPNHLLGILAATLAMNFFGALYYGPLFGNLFYSMLKRFRGVTAVDKEHKKIRSLCYPMWVALVSSLFAALVLAISLMLLFNALKVRSYAEGASVTLLVWLIGRVLTVEESVWQGAPPKLMVLAAAKQLVASQLQSAIIFTAMTW